MRRPLVCLSTLACIKCVIQHGLAVWVTNVCRNKLLTKGIKVECSASVVILWKDGVTKSHPMKLLLAGNSGENHDIATYVCTDTVRITAMSNSISDPRPFWFRKTGRMRTNLEKESTKLGSS